MRLPIPLSHLLHHLPRANLPFLSSYTYIVSGIGGVCQILLWSFPPLFGNTLAYITPLKAVLGCPFPIGSLRTPRDFIIGITKDKVDFNLGILFFEGHHLGPI